jgi:RNA polymerase sigma-70 factor (ECF subfamily)
VTPQAPQVSDLLLRWGSGDEKARDQLIPVLYDELRRLARNYMRRERPNHTLQTSALVNEAYLRLVDKNVPWQSRAHFFGIAARLMRQILVDHARARNYAKRGGNQQQVTLDGADIAQGQAADIIAVDDALQGLSAIDAEQCRIVELRFFGGLTIPETAEVMGISHATVEREWSLARAWLRRELTRK